MSSAATAKATATPTRLAPSDSSTYNSDLARHVGTPSPSRSRTYLADEARTQASSPSSLSPAVLPTSHSWNYGQDLTGASHPGLLTGQSPVRRAGSLKSSSSPGVPRPAGSSLPRRSPSQGDTERAREKARGIRERRLSSTSREDSLSSPIPRNEPLPTDRTSLYSPSPPPPTALHSRSVGQSVLLLSSSARSGLAPSSSSSPRKVQSEVNGTPFEMQTLARNHVVQNAGPSVSTSYPSSSADPTLTTTPKTTSPRARTRSNPTRYAPSGLAAAEPVPLTSPTSSTMRSNRSHDGSTLIRKGSTGSRVNGSASPSHRIDGPSGLTTSASTDSISSRGYPNGQEEAALSASASASPIQQRSVSSGNTAKIAPPASPPRKSSKSHKLTPKQLAKRKAEEANRRDREADEAAARAAAAAAAAAVAAAIAAQDQSGSVNENVIGLRDIRRQANSDFDSPSDALDSDNGHLSPLGKPRKLDYGEEPSNTKHRGPETTAQIPRSTSAFVNGTPSTSGRDDSMQFRLPTSTSSMTNRNGLAGPSKLRSASEPPDSTSARTQLASQRNALAARAATIDWDEMIPPAIARRLAQEELLRRDPLLRNQEGLIDTWDRDGLPLTQVEIQVLAQDAVRREEGGGGGLDSPAELAADQEQGGELAAAPPPLLDEGIEMHDLRAREEEREAREAMQRQEEEMRRLRREDEEKKKREEEEQEQARRRKLCEEQQKAEASASSSTQPHAQAQVRPIGPSEQQQQLQRQVNGKKAPADKEKEPGCCAGCIVM
ncbi:hypothetical protein BCV69DRAFT_280871 [Microstroma glucosiphilum]|uniref:Uncharacterized protein n=1 Tax=Pseudomicrostroma glucosiphilum TaxID=1684307 RepID=A0A316UH52_9BASI|nr:hypothetical protein BCV69DRAFT_280871 [Pseudomicrostroma glucosiphilum]PWN23263.1 hypothetical protein BCV69DRAFT_280871 [Pseudomicrostroma glucosiphilum]